jgi:hypothetical protein
MKCFHFFLVCFFSVCLPFYGFSLGENAVVMSVNGVVEVRTSEDSKWMPAVTGMLLSDGALISTGFRSSAEIFLSGATVKISSLSRFSVIIPEYIENTEEDGVRLLDEKSDHTLPKLVPSAPIGFAENIRIKIENPKRNSYSNNPMAEAGFERGAPLIPRTVDVSIEWATE